MEDIWLTREQIWLLGKILAFVLSMVIIALWKAANSKD